MSNVLQNLGDIPQFDSIQAEHVRPALEAALQAARDTIANIKTQETVTWHNTIEPLTDVTERVGRIWGVVSHLQSVVNTPELRAVYNELMPDVTRFFTEIGQDITLYERFKSIKESPEFQNLSAAQQTKLIHDLRGFVLSGAELAPDDQARLAALDVESAQLSAQFSQNVLDATDAFALYFDNETALSGIPQDALAMFASAARAEGKTGYKVGLQMPHYLAVMQHANDRQLRRKLYDAHSTRASELDHDGKFDNTANIERRLFLSLEQAKLLGFDNFAQLSLFTKMASSPEEVIHFIRDLSNRAKPFAQKDYTEVCEFARDTLKIDDPQPWDLVYASEKLREARFAFSETEMRKYFPISKVLSGLFAQINALYGIEFQERIRPVWHPEVRYFDLKQNGEVFGGIYLDLYAREGKRGGAWMNDYRGRRRFSHSTGTGQVQSPIAYLVCNFTPPLGDAEARLSHDEIVTLFHEMGHGLHHLLTQVDELGVSGINGVEWDAVELPSQFMENFAWEFDVLHSMSEHETDRTPLPRSLFDKMRAAKNFQSGMFVVRQMEFALFDMLLYSQTDPERLTHYRQLLAEVRREVAVVHPPETNRFANSFGHIFSGGYAAGYYSYAWAEVLSADAYAAFEESQNIRETGARFWREILAVGGSRSAMESFTAFRGRAPKPDALLRQKGLSRAA